MGTYGQQLAALTYAIARLVAQPGQPAPRGTDLRVALDCRHQVVRTIRGLYRQLTQPRDLDHRGHRSLAAVERDPLDTYARLLDQVTRDRDPDPEQARDWTAHTPTSPLTAGWQHAAHHAVLLDDTLAPAHHRWQQDAAGAWKGVADLAALGRALPWLDADLARANQRVNPEEQQALRYSARSGLATAAAAVEGIARSGPLSGWADSAQPPASPTPIQPVREFADLAPAQHKVTAQLHAAGPHLSVAVLSTVAVGQARANLHASRILRAAGETSLDPLAEALWSRARALNQITVHAQAGATSIYPGRGDQRAAIQTGEIMRFLRTQQKRNQPPDRDTTGELIEFARAGTDVVTALHTATRDRFDRNDYVVRSHGETAEWTPIRDPEQAPLLQAARTAADIDTVTAAVQDTDPLTPAQDELNTAVNDRLLRPPTPDARRTSFDGPALGPRPPRRTPPLANRPTPPDQRPRGRRL